MECQFILPYYFFSKSRNASHIVTPKTEVEGMSLMMHHVYI